jgi:hypothetical protein
MNWFTVLLGVILGVTLVDMSVGSTSTIGDAIWWLISLI